MEKKRNYYSMHIDFCTPSHWQDEGLLWDPEPLHVIIIRIMVAGIVGEGHTQSIELYLYCCLLRLLCSKSTVDGCSRKSGSMVSKCMAYNIL